MKNRVVQNWAAALGGSAAVLFGIGVGLFVFAHPLVSLRALAALGSALALAALIFTGVLAARVGRWASAAGYRHCWKSRFQARAFVWITILGVYALAWRGFLLEPALCLPWAAFRTNTAGQRKAAVQRGKQKRDEQA